MTRVSMAFSGATIQATRTTTIPVPTAQERETAASADGQWLNAATAKAASAIVPVQASSQPSEPEPLRCSTAAPSASASWHVSATSVAATTA
ncbi:unnamed protein product [Trichogramma brassicae]|uniref:Uncharacterized protein n=1 Tax=Trichogramma brassicae TaxID=86971 RepID=A0A6H5HZV8_9HYME|nr:unnamed protein product [Trichogramma brassicae]